eukprot:m.11393 g.11393  ORF g.11393 m.11393 type:complete len:85 (+) comp5715_c0_seq1:270-524(+)
MSPNPTPSPNTTTIVFTLYQQAFGGIAHTHTPAHTQHAFQVIVSLTFCSPDRISIQQLSIDSAQRIATTADRTCVVCTRSQPRQ